jgi:putative ABC transport system permease protein
MTASLRGEIVQWADGSIIDKFYVSPLPDVPIEALSQVLEDSDPDGKSFLGVETATARTYVPFLLLGLHPKEIAHYGPCRDDPSMLRAIAQGDGVIVSKRLARHFGYAVGDRVHVSNASGVVRDLDVVAVSDEYGYFPNPDERMYGVVGTGFMKSNFCLEVDRVREAAIRLAPGADADHFKAAIQEFIPTLHASNFRTGESLVDVHLVDIDRDFFLFDIILGLTAMLAGLGVLNGQLLATLERAKELGVLKALGVTRAQIAGTVLCESLVIGVLGGLVGTALGAVLTPVIVRALESLSGLDLPNVGAGIWLVICPVGAIVIALAAAAYPIARMNRMDAVAAVRTG